MPSWMQYVVLVLVVLAFVIIPFATVAGFWHMAGRSLKKSRAAQLERKFLQIVKTKCGRVTDVELALESRATLDQCRQFLKSMVEHGAAQTHVGPEGRAVYVFHGFLTEEQKKAAVSPSDWTPSWTISADKPPPLDLPTKPVELGTKPVHLEPKPLDLER